MNTVKFEKCKTLAIAHRGVSGIEPENTNFSFVAAGNRSYFGIETDVHVTADGNFILTHDSNTKRVSGVDMIVEESNFDDLRALCLFDKDGSADRIDIRMPTLEEYVKICQKYEKVAVLELKEAMSEDAVGAIVDRIEAAGYLDRTIFISFDFNNLVYVRRKKPMQTVQYLIGETLTEEMVQRVKDHRFDIDVYYKHLTEELIREWHESGIRINCWTVDDHKEAEQFAAWGVDYITTNILE